MILDFRIAYVAVTAKSSFRLTSFLPLPRLHPPRPPQDHQNGELEPVVVMIGGALIFEGTNRNC